MRSWRSVSGRLRVVFKSQVCNLLIAYLCLRTDPRSWCQRYSALSTAERLYPSCRRPESLNMPIVMRRGSQMQLVKQIRIWL
jgi:hypothetical protein